MMHNGVKAKGKRVEVMDGVSQVRKPYVFGAQEGKVDKGGRPGCLSDDAVSSRGCIANTKVYFRLKPILESLLDGA